MSCYNTVIRYQLVNGGPVAQQPQESSQKEQADLNVCIFPHLNRFLVIDARPENPSTPELHCLATTDVLNEPFYTEVEKDFREILRQPDRPLPYLMTLPQQLESILRYKALKAIARALESSFNTQLPERVALLFCTGEMLNAPIDQVQGLLEEMVGEDADPETVYRWAQQFQELQQEEKQKLNLEMLERQREAVSPSEGGFFTLWENPGKATN